MTQQCKTQAGCFRELARVEDKPVFILDTLYNELGEKFTVRGVSETGHCFDVHAGETRNNFLPKIKNCSWNPPAPMRDCPTHGDSAQVKDLKAHNAMLVDVLRDCRTGINWYINHSNESDGSDTEMLEAVDEALSAYKT